ncbi:MAG: enoyl-CoA hydratase [Alphaproteobacteria bacterium]|nr:enoyl-CoA hydratase [Alphaproteobacteria bacterium]
MTIATVVAAGIARVTIDRPPLNLLDAPTILDLTRALAALKDRRDLHFVVLEGKGGRAFIGGADLNTLRGLRPATARAFITRLHRLCLAIRESRLPVVAAIDGHCLGAGLEVAAACDLRVATTRSLFSMPEVRVGIPSVIEAALLPRLIGWGRAAELVYLGTTIDAQTALTWGLVNRVAGTLDEALAPVSEALSAGGKRALRLQKALLRRWERLPTPLAVRAGIGALAEAYREDEPARMMQAWFDRKRRKN